MPRSVMIFAAGFGTRMGELTKHRPKPLVQVASKALVDHALDVTSIPEVSKICVNTHYHADQMSDHLAPRSNVELIYETEILETGGGLKNALPKLGKDPVFTLNSDAVWSGDNPLRMLENAWNEGAMDGLLLLVPRSNARLHLGKGDFHLINGRLVRRGDAPSADYVYSGAALLRTDGLARITQDAFSLNVLWDQMLAQDRLFGAVYHGDWVDVGTPDGIAEAEKMLNDVV